MKTIIQLLIISLLLLLLLLLGGSWYFTSTLLQPTRDDCSSKHYLYCNNPAELDLSFRDVVFKTKDGLNIRGWFVKGKSKKAGVLLVHGTGGTRHAGLRYAPSLHEKGFNLLLIDLRNSGESDVFFNSMGFHERNDIHAGVEFLSKTKKLTSIGVFGFSMGGAAAIMAMSENPLIKAGIVDSSFLDFETIISEKVKSRYGIPAYPFISAIKFLFEKRINGDVTDLTPLTAIPKIFPRPIFIIHGTNDSEVPLIHGVKLYVAAKHPKKIWPVKNGKHTQAWQFDRERAEKDIPQFFHEQLQQ